MARTKAARSAPTAQDVSNMIAELKGLQPKTVTAFDSVKQALPQIEVAIDLGYSLQEICQIMGKYNVQITTRSLKQYLVELRKAGQPNQTIEQPQPDTRSSSIGQPDRSIEATAEVVIGQPDRANETTAEAAIDNLMDQTAATIEQPILGVEPASRSTERSADPIDSPERSTLSNRENSSPPVQQLGNAGAALPVQSDAAIAQQIDTIGVPLSQSMQHETAPIASLDGNQTDAASATTASDSSNLDATKTATRSTTVAPSAATASQPIEQQTRTKPAAVDLSSTPPTALQSTTRLGKSAATKPITTATTRAADSSPAAPPSVTRSPAVNPVPAAPQQAEIQTAQ